MSQRRRPHSGPSRLFGVHPNSARTEGGRDANYRIRFARSPAKRGDAGHPVGGSGESESHTRRQQRAGVLFHASRSGARRHRSDWVDEVVFAADGRTGNRLSGRSSLTTPALSRVFRLLYYQTRAHLSVGARTASFSAASVHPCHPNLLSPFTIINSVLPTKHLFDHHRP